MWYEGEESRTGAVSYCELNWTDACVVPVRVPSLSPVQLNPPMWLGFTRCLVELIYQISHVYRVQSSIAK